MITDVKVDGNRVVYSASCRAASKAVTTSSRGDRSDGSDTTGGSRQVDGYRPRAANVVQE